MKLKYTFENVNMDDDEIIAVPVGSNAGEFHGVLKINSAAQEILNLINNNLSEEEVVLYLEKKYSNERNTLERYVHTVIDELGSIGVLQN